MSVGAEGDQEQGLGVVKQESKYRKASVEDEVKTEGGWKGMVGMVGKRGTGEGKGGKFEVKVEGDGGVVEA